MNYDFPLWKPSRRYASLAEVPGVWRDGYDKTLNLAELEDNLKLSPWDRLLKHDKILANFLKREEFFDLMRRGRSFLDNMESNRANQKSKI